MPSAAASVVYDTVPPPVPTGLTAVTPTNQKPALSWVSGGNDATSGFVNYQVYRGATLVGIADGHDVHGHDARDERKPDLHGQGGRRRRQRLDRLGGEGGHVRHGDPERARAERARGDERRRPR